MPRPKNLVVVNNGVVFSVPPKKLRAYLEAKAAGTSGSLPAEHMIGVVVADLSALDMNSANQLLTSLTPVNDPVTVTEEVPF